MRLRTWVLATTTTACLLAGCSGTEDQETAAEPQATGASESAEPGDEASEGKSKGKGAERKAKAPADVVTQGPKTGDLLVHGTVTRDGEPVEGAEVRAALMAEDLDSLEIGEVVPMWETPSVETGEQGRYAVRLDPEEIDEQFFRKGADYLNFLLRVESDGMMAERSAAASLVGKAGLWRSSGAKASDPVIEMSVDLDAETVTVTDSRGEASEEELAVFEVQQG
ncbi:hypothetical protein [Nocardioides sp. SYSU DS0663]|uniref:hypothetical protein n=1 Tax=Nocardioides sp. SYSU DS0663 TaxID=3416445 RepID=UPI003F4C14C1